MLFLFILFSRCCFFGFCSVFFLCVCSFRVFGFCVVCCFFVVVLLGFFLGVGVGGWVGRRLPCPDSPTLELTKTRTVSTGVQRSASLFPPLPPAARREVSGCKTGRGQMFFLWGVGGWADSPTLKLTKPRTVSTGVQRSAGLFQSLPPAAGREVPGCRTGRGGAWLGAGPV